WGRIEDGYLLRFHGLADFLIDLGGQRVTCVAATANTSPVTLRHLVIDHVLPRVLNLLGFDALHATAVVIGDGACAFVAEAGTGKSTIAASFHIAGYPAFCDDCLVLRDTDPVTALPAYPGVRLWEEAFRALGGAAADSAIPVAQYTGKTRHLGGAEGFCGEPLPLARIYLLQRENQTNLPGNKAFGASSGLNNADAAILPSLEPMKPGEAFAGLIAATFPLDISDSAMLGRHFRMVSRVAAEVPIRRLTIPTAFAALPAARAMILADLATG
ncbi:MAG: hypothetical protein ABSG46_11840, partial [Candidatus Binataceae bacterium]